MTAENTRTCPTCATAIPASFPEGFCPKCMLASATPAAVVEQGEADKTIAVPAPTPSQILRPGGVPSLDMLRRMFPDLEILDVLGAGGMGAVYKARQPRLNRLIALKIMVAAPGHETDFALRFEREAQVLARLSHPHIVILYDFGELGPERTGADPLFYFLMEYVDGTDLGQLIKSKELKPAQALAIVPQICEALQYAHDQGITHRDIKPANILIDKRGVVKIADFGLAKMITGTEEALMTGLTQTGTAMGTPHYMAPEQWDHPEQVDHRADIYALGVVFYEMLTGERPAGVFEPPSKKTKPPVDKKIDGVVMRAMDKNPARRYQQAGQIGDDVTRISGANKSRPATAKGAPEPKRSPLKPMLAVGVATALAVGGWMLWQGEPTAAVTSKTALGGPSALPKAPAPPQAAWVPMYRQAAELAPLFGKPQALYPDFQSHVALVQDPASGLKLADGWLTPTTTHVKLPLPSARNAGVRMRVQMSEPTVSASIGLRGVDRGAVYAASWRGINRYFSTASKAAEYLAERKNFVAKKPGESFTLEFYAIGRDLIFRYDGEVIRVREPGEDPAIGTLNHLMIRNPVTDIEFINLDGLSEAEALKLAGVAEGGVTAPQASFSWGGSRYAFVNDKLSWPEARKRAEAAGGRLAVFETEAEERAVREHYRAALNKQRYWIGGHAEKGSKEIRWITGEPVGKVTWGAGHPDWRSNPASPEAQSEGLLFAGALGVDVIAEGADRWIIIQPEYKTGLGFILEWNDAAAPVNPALGRAGRLRAAGITANGKPHDLTKFAAYGDFVDVAGGWSRWVALRADGQTISSDGKADFTDIAKIAASFNAEYASITKAGKLVIPDYEKWTLPSSLEQGVVDAALGMQHGIALLKGGRAVVFGARYDGTVGDPAEPKQYGTPRWPLPEAHALEKVQAVAATVTHAATLHEDGTLSLWGWEGPIKWQADPRQKPLRQLRSTQDEFWALDEAGQLWHLPVPRNPAPGQPVYSTGKPIQSEAGVTHLGPRCWRRKSGEWIAKMNTNDGTDLMKAAGISESTAFSLDGGLFNGQPSASLLWIEPVGAQPTTPTTSTATKAAPFVNTLGMKFVPVPITGGPTDGQRVLFSIWETRVQDYEAFAQETKREWAKPGFPQEPTHPACMVTLADAEAFCLWLTERERKAGKLPATAAYRLPSDHEWSCAVGIGAQEDAAISSWDKDGKVPGHPWGSAWPPPAGAGNFNGEEAPWSGSGGRLTGYRDAFPNTGPVGSFAANALGLHDLIGNVWERCLKPDSKGQQSLHRGGSCQDVRPESLTSSKRGFMSVDKFESNIGFRIVLESAPSATAVPPKTALGGPSALPQATALATLHRPRGSGVGAGAGA